MAQTSMKRIAGLTALTGGIGLTTCFLIASVSCVRADEPDSETRAIIDKAVKAHGGADKLSPFKAVSFKRTGKHKIENVEWGNAVAVVTYEMPDKVRLDTEVENAKGGKFSFTRAVNGKIGWVGSTRATRDMKEADIAQIVDEFYAHWLASVVPLKDKALTFSIVGGDTVDGKDAVGVRVSCKGRPDVNLFFDKKTGLVIKSERRTKDPATNEEYTAESFYLDHKEFQGVLWPTRRLDRRDGKDLDEDSGRFELSEFQALDKLDESLLARPR